MALDDPATDWAALDKKYNLGKAPSEKWWKEQSEKWAAEREAEAKIKAKITKEAEDAAERAARLESAYQWDVDYIRDAHAKMRTHAQQLVKERGFKPGPDNKKRAAPTWAPGIQPGRKKASVKPFESRSGPFREEADSEAATAAALDKPSAKVKAMRSKSKKEARLRSPTR